MAQHHENISAVLEAVGFYDRYAEAVRRVIPGYGREWKSKIVLPSLLSREGFRLFSVVAQKPGGTRVKAACRSMLTLGFWPQRISSSARARCLNTTTPIA